MRLADFRKILPHLKEVERVVLEGWGESLLHRDLTQCIALVKEQGPSVGFVTSAKGLDSGRVSELVEAGLDFIGFSIAGTTPATHDAIRINSKLREVIDAVRLFRREKARRKLNRPSMHLILLMLKQNIGEVPEVPLFAKDLGIEEVLLTNSCHWMTAWQEEQGIFTWSGETNEYEQYVRKAEAQARKLKVNLRRPALVASEVAVCEENPLATLYVAVDGEVSPCVYLNPPISSPFRRVYCGKYHEVERVSFGNIFREDFREIWGRTGYENFRECFVRRKKSFEERYGWLAGKGEVRKIDADPLPGAPEGCRTCHKILGV